MIKINLKKPALLFTGIALSLLLLTGCKKETATAPEVTVPNNFFPIASGERAVFQIDTLDNGTVLNAGTVKTFWLTSRTKDSILYFPRVDTVLQYGTTTVTTKYIRTTNAGAYLNFDTTGISFLLPDTLKKYISIDKEIAFLSYPLTPGRKWYAFKISAVALSLIDVMAEAKGPDTVVVYSAGPALRIAAQKVDYKLTYAIPAFLFPGGINQTYTGSVWYAENRGIVKTSGNPQLVGILLGSSPVIADTSTVYTQTRIF